MTTTSKPWEHAKEGGSEQDALAARFVESLSQDTRLYAADIRGSLAHARMLRKVGLLTADDLAQIERGLDEIQREIESSPAGVNAVGIPGAWQGWKPELEDVHMCVEAALVEKIGDAGRRLHTGRSRNDQVALDLRLWLRDACQEAIVALDGLLRSLESLAATQGDMLLPSYTHMQRAQPICVGAEAMAWHAMFTRDRLTFQGLTENHLGLGASPLGAGAVAGSLLPIDRQSTTAELGFLGVAGSSIDATASRDEALDFLYLLSRTALHLSRLAEQWILYCSTEFGFIELSPAHTTGSSMMPQKRNPDMLELIRGRSGTIIGHHVALLTIVKGLPIAYNRDLQEDKRHVFGAYDVALDCIRMAARVVAGATFNSDRILKSAGGLDRGYPDATALAEHLVTNGVPFRTAHQIVGVIVRACITQGFPTLRSMPPEAMRAVLGPLGVDASTIDATLHDVLGPENVVKAYRSFGHGGTGPGGYKDLLAAALAARGTPLRPEEPTLTDQKRQDRVTESLGFQPEGSRKRPANDATTANKSMTALFDLGGKDPHTKARKEATEKRLIDAYASVGRTLDDLPYTPEFERVYSLATAGETAADVPSRQDIFKRMHNLRKAAKMPALGKAASTPPKVSSEVEAWLRDAVVAAVGSLGQRDQLPYSDVFEQIVAELNQKTGQDIQPHDAWRLVAKIAK